MVKTRSVMLGMVTLGWLGCATVRPHPEPGPGDVARGAGFGVENMTALAEGRTLLLERCSACHEAPTPGRFGPERWEVEVGRMYQRAGLNDVERALVLGYLQTFAR